MAATPLVPPPSAQLAPAVSRDVRLAADVVPPGGIITSFLGNQIVYCSIVCPLVVETGATAVGTALAAPATFVTALQSGNVLKAIGVAAASVTGPTDAAATAAIAADGTLVAPRVLNAFEVGVVGLLDVIPAAAGGLPGIVSAIEAAREATFTAQHAPIVPNPTPTAMPNGVVQVAIISAINVGAAVIFPAFNLLLNAVFQVPDAAAQELAASGDPVRAVDAGATTAVGALTAAAGVVTDSVVTAVNDIRTAAEQSSHRTAQPRTASITTTSTRAGLGSSRRPATTTTHSATKPDSVHPVRDLVPAVGDAARTVRKTGSQRPHPVNEHHTRDK